MRKILPLIIGLLVYSAVWAATAPTVCTAPDGSVLSYTAPPTIVVPPPPPPTSGTITYGYFNGTWTWGGDFTQNNTSVDYHDTVGDPGKQDIAFRSTAPYGLYLPYFGLPSANFLISNPPYSAVTFDIKPTKTNAAFTVMFVRAGDTSTGPGCTVALKPAPAGTWTTFVTSLTSVCVAGDKQLYKMVIQDSTGTSPNLWYLRNMGFVN